LVPGFVGDCRQLESLAADNAYHLARIVLLRQLCQARPQPSGDFTW
jgi:hypothetical protein